MAYNFAVGATGVGAAPVPRWAAKRPQNRLAMKLLILAAIDMFSTRQRGAKTAGGLPQEPAPGCQVNQTNRISSVDHRRLLVPQPSSGHNRNGCPTPVHRRSCPSAEVSQRCTLGRASRKRCSCSMIAGAHSLRVLPGGPNTR